MMPLGVCATSWLMPTRSAGVDVKCRNPAEFSHRAYSRLSEFTELGAVALPLKKMFCQSLVKPSVLNQPLMVMARSECSDALAGTSTKTFTPSECKAGPAALSGRVVTAAGGGALA